jgi:Tol biopolymer transport system component
MNKSRLYLCLLVILMLGLSSLSFAQTPSQLFQQGLLKENGEGDLKAAVAIYEKIVDNATAERSLRAQSLLHIGLCWEKLGKEEAQKAYQRIIQEFAEQYQLVAEARTRLAALEQLTSFADANGMVVRRVWAGPDVDLTGALSPDRTYLTYTDWATGDLAVRELATGENRRLTNKGPWSESDEYALGSTVSPDGGLISYAWSNEEFFFELRIVGIDGSESRVVYHNEEVKHLQPAQWSPDGKSVLLLLKRKDKTNQIVLVSAEGGPVRVLKTLDWRYPSKMSFSPDGRYIVYDFPPQEDIPERDIFVLATDGSGEGRLVEHPANDFVMGWAPDGRHVLFGSDRMGTVGAWVVAVTDGKPKGSPALVNPDMSHVSAIGFARNGSYYYGIDAGALDVYIATLDFKTGKLVAPAPALSRRSVLGPFGLDWSPKGTHLAYLARRPAVGVQGPRTLVIRSVVTGQERELSPRLNHLFRPRWAPDGSSILVSGSDQKNRRGFYSINTQTGGVTPIVRFEEAGGIIQWPTWSRDGRVIFYQHLGGPDHPTGIFGRDLKTGGERELYRGSVGNEMALSPDGTHLAFSLFDKQTQSGALMVIPTVGGETRELLRSKEGQEVRPIAWTPDGLIYALYLYGSGIEEDSTQPQSELWRMSLGGGAHQKLDVPIKTQHWIVSFHPDGQRVAFIKGELKWELWVMENFMPELKVGK